MAPGLLRKRTSLMPAPAVYRGAALLVFWSRTPSSFAPTPGTPQAEVELSQAVGYDDHTPAGPPGGRAPRHAGQDAEAKQRLRQMAVPTRRAAARGDIIDEAFA